MTVKEIFELRREGKVEEAYNAILPMYKVHHGKYTTLAMFWCAVDMINLLLSRTTGDDSASLESLREAERIYLSLQKISTQIRDENGTCQRTIVYLGEAFKTTRMRIDK